MALFAHIIQTALLFILVGMATGVEPAPRFGHSCVGLGRSLEDTDLLAFTGGSDGNDLIRNGVELYEVRVPSTPLSMHIPASFAVAHH